MLLFFSLFLCRMMAPTPGMQTQQTCTYHLSCEEGRYIQTRFGLQALRNHYYFWESLPQKDRPFHYQALVQAQVGRPPNRLRRYRSGRLKTETEYQDGVIA